ncbi:N-acetylglucosamine kinase [Algivirga pacifica]|uniref:ATPase n=1 Tax=Algivirga pacifica TaxID=1162670 RepID=A0ABP9D3P8_9BACT
MILIADSGSTKTQWVVLDPKTKQITKEFTTKGLNPYFWESTAFVTYLQETLPSVKEVQHLFFYGAGCGLEKQAEWVKTHLSKALEIPHIEVFSDMLGAARGLFLDRPGIACIMGTGTNSCLYDGTQIIKTVPSIGYILGDWGSGAVLGKEFIGLLLTHQLPRKVEDAFHQEYHLQKVDILNNLYRKAYPNRFLASFTHFIYKHIEVEVIEKMVRENFRLFFSYFVKTYEETEHSVIFPVHIVGSVAFYFQDLLREEGEAMGIDIQRIQVSPMEGLITFHLK